MLSEKLYSTILTKRTFEWNGKIGITKGVYRVMEVRECNLEGCIESAVIGQKIILVDTKETESPASN